MQIKVNKTDLLTNLNFCRLFIENNKLELFKNFLITAKENILSIEATNFEHYIEAKVDCEIMEEGTFCVNADALIKTIKSLETDEIIFKANNDKSGLIIEDENSKFELFLMNYEDWSKITEKIDSDLTYLTFNSNEFQNILDLILPVVNDTHYRPYLTGILFSLNGNNLKLVGSDNTKLIVKNLHGIEILKKLVPQVIIPKKTLKNINLILKNKIIKKLDTKVEILFNRTVTEISVKNDLINIIITTRNIEDTYPDINNLFQRENEIELKFNKEKFIKAIKKINLLLNKNDDESFIFVEIKKDKCIMKGTSEMGKIKVECPMNTETENFKFAFVPQNILLIEKFLPDEISLNFVDNQSPCLIQNENFNYLFTLVYLEQLEEEVA